MKLVKNNCWGGYGLSRAVYDELGIKWDGYGYKFEDDRTNEKLIQAIEKVGLKASSGSCANLEIVEIPDGIDWEIDDYDGMETIREVADTW